MFTINVLSIFTKFDYVEIMGRIASVIILIALLMPSIKKLRLINATGAFLMLIYGLFNGALPVIIMNSGSVIINIFHLIKIYRKNITLTNVEFNKEDEYLKQLLLRYNLLNEEGIISNYNINKIIVIYANMQPINIIFKSNETIIENITIQKYDRRKTYDIYVNKLINS